MADEYTDADLARIAVSDAPVLDTDAVDRIQFLLRPHLPAFTTADVAPVTELPTPERREAPGRAA